MDASLVPTSGNGLWTISPKIIIFFIDTHHLEDALSWAPDLMDLDSKDENEVLMPSAVDDSVVDISFSSNESTLVDSSFEWNDSTRIDEANKIQDSEPPLINIYKTGPDLDFELLLAKNYIDAHPHSDFTNAIKNIKILKDNNNLGDSRLRLEASKLTIWNASLFRRKRKGVTNIGFQTTISNMNDQAKEKADVARANGMCPGYPTGHCKNKNQAVPGRIYCEECQDKVKNNGLAVQESHRKQDERATDNKVTIPFSTQMAALGASNIQSLLPASSLKKLSVSNTVGVDTANAIRSVEAKHMYIVGAYYVDSNGSHMAFWANRIGNDEEWLSATWNIRINNIPVPGGDIFVMLDSFASFAAGRQIVFSTGNNACDYKRLTSAYK